MKRGRRQIILIFAVFSIIAADQVSAQSTQQVPYGINYQAVARNATGRELANTNVDIRFTILSGTPLGTVAYQEVHNDVATTRYGVFSVTIGKGIPSAGLYEEFSEVRWEDDAHFLRVEIRFAADFIEMGTMQFLSVPYALFAARSLEPGPPGPAGPPGDPATNNQGLSFDGVNLSIDDGKVTPSVLGTVNLGVLVNNPDDEIQDLRLDEKNILKITRNEEATEIDLSRLVNDADPDPTNEIQQLIYNPATHLLSIEEGMGTDSIDLSGLENKISSVEIEGSNLVITEGGVQKSVDLSSNMVAFRARKDNSESGLTPLEDYDFVANDERYDIGSDYNHVTGEFTAPLTGIYTFNVGYTASGIESKLYLYLDNAEYETLQTSINGGASLNRSVTMRLLSGQVVKVRFNPGTSTQSGTGTFSGYKVF